MSEGSKSHWIIARDKPGLFLAMLRALVGNARVSYEGDLSRCQLSKMPGSSVEETAVLKQCVLDKSLDFIVCPLEPATIDAIWQEVIPAGRLTREIMHIQIEKNGELAFGAYDNFHPDCTLASPLVPEALLHKLASAGVIRSFFPVDKQPVPENLG